MNAEGAVSITNSTVSGNFGGVGGGIQNSGSMTIINSTIAGNSVGSQGGQGSGIANTGLRTTLINTIVANDPAGGNCLGQSRPTAATTSRTARRVGSRQPRHTRTRIPDSIPPAC